MNWKIIAGGLLVFGGLAELFSILNGQAGGNPGIAAKLACIVLVFLGGFLIFKGRKK